jgi:hypothetical protein
VGLDRRDVEVHEASELDTAFVPGIAAALVGGEEDRFSARAELLSGPRVGERDWPIARVREHEVVFYPRA